MQSHLGQLRDSAPVLAPWELLQVIKRCGYNNHQLALLTAIDYRTLVNRIDRATEFIPVDLSDTIREKMGAEIFDIALKEIRDGVANHELYINGTEMDMIMSHMGWNYTQLGRHFARHRTFVSNRLRWDHNDRTIPLRYAVILRDKIGQAKYNQLLGYIRHQYSARIPATKPAHALPGGFDAKAYMAGRTQDPTKPDMRDAEHSEDDGA